MSETSTANEIFMTELHDLIAAAHDSGVSDKEIIGELADAAEALSDLPAQETQPTGAMGGPRVGKATGPVPFIDASDSARVADVPNLTPAAPLTAPPGTPSIAVLAFTNMTGEVDQEYFSDSISEDIATQLSHSDAALCSTHHSC
jgi:hypothetical protein